MQFYNDIWTEIEIMAIETKKTYIWRGHLKFNYF